MFLLFGLGAKDVVVDNGLVHADGVLPVVAASGKLVGILDADFVTLGHVLLQHVQVDGAHIYHGLVGGGHRLLHFALGEVAFGGAGEAHNHGIVALVQSLDGDGEVFGRLQGHVVGAVFGRLAVLVGIDAEHGEVARVARPHPVVRFAAELAHARRGCGYHAHVAVHFIINKVILVSGVEGQGQRLDAGFAFQVAFLPFFLGKLAQEGGGHGFVFVHLAGLDFGVHQVGDVHDAVHEAELQSRRGQLFSAAFGPEAVRQVVVLHAAVLLYGRVSAVVVGEDEAFGRDDFARASAAEDAHRILQ